MLNTSYIFLKFKCRNLKRPAYGEKPFHHFTLESKIEKI